MIIDINNSECTVIIINYNGSADTLLCLKSIESSTIDTSVIIVDNCSNLEDYIKLKENCKKAKLIRSNVNLGFAGGNNLGISEAFKYNSINKIILLNNDTEIRSNCIEVLLKYLKEGVIVTPKMLYYNDKNRIWYAGGHINKITGRAIHDHMNEIDQISSTETVDCDFTSGCCMGFTVKDLKRLGFLNESYFMYCEDTEFCLRAVNKGIKIRYVPQSVIYHKVSQSTGGGESAFCLYYMTRNRLRYLNEYNNYFSIFAVPFTLVTRYIRILQFVLKRDKKWRAISRGICDFYSHIDGNSY